MTNNQLNLSFQMNTKSKMKKWIKNLYSCRYLYLLLLPGIVSVFIFHYIPIYGVQIAFKNFRTSLGIWGSEWIGIDHFVKFIRYPAFWQIIKNTIFLNLYTLATFPCSIIFALMINELNNQKYKKTVQMLTYAPHFVSTVVVVSMFSLMLNRESGIVNNIAVLLGGERRDFMGEPGLFSTIYVWSGVWQTLGWGTIIYLAALSNVSPDMIEAARIDGANRFQIIRHIKIPTILPTIITLLILRTGSMMTIGFEKIFLMQNPLNLGKSQVISTYVYNIGIIQAQFSYSAAIGLFNNVINIIIIMLVNSIMKKTTKIGLW